MPLSGLLPCRDKGSHVPVETETPRTEIDGGDVPALPWAMAGLPQQWQ